MNITAENTRETIIRNGFILGRFYFKWLVKFRSIEKLIQLIYDWTHTVVQPNLLIVHICCNKKDG